MPKRGARKDEWVRTYYCIDPDTFDILKVHLTAANVLQQYDSSGSVLRTHAVERNRKPDDEIGTVFRLALVLAVATIDDAGGLAEEHKEAVERVAAEMKKKAQMQQPQGRLWNEGKKVRRRLRTA